MKIIFSRKGFDTGSGGKPSPIINNVPVSLPIPGANDEPYQYKDIVHPIIGPISHIVEDVTKQKYNKYSPTHADPTLPKEWGYSTIGQSGAASAHLHNQNVSVGDVFVFFGLFKDVVPHHRIFGMMEITKTHLIPEDGCCWKELQLKEPHPHTERTNQAANNTLYVGNGQVAHNANDVLRLSKANIPSEWEIPNWLHEHGLSYHSNRVRWTSDTLKVVNRGQEFVSDVGNDINAISWLNHIKRSMRVAPHT